MVFTKLNLTCSHIHLLKQFYSRLFESNFIYDGHEIVIKAGQTQVHIHEGTNTKPYHIAFTIPSNQIESSLQWLKEKVLPLWIDDYNGYIAEFSNWNARSVYFLDPVSNVIELIARLDLEILSNEKFSLRLIRCVSEIGIVFPEESYESSVDRLLQDFRLDYFDKQPPLRQFRAIGNQEGMFIAVPQNRPWYPTHNIVSDLAPVDVEFFHLNRQFKYSSK